MPEHACVLLPDEYLIYRNDAKVDQLLSAILGMAIDQVGRESKQSGKVAGGVHPLQWTVGG